MTLDFRCIAAERAIPFSLVHHLMAEMRSTMNGNRAEPDSEQILDGDVLAIAENMDEQRRMRAVSTALRELVLRQTQSSPLVVTLDDCHLADASSLTVLGFLMRWAPKSKLMIVAAMTEGEPVHAGPELTALCDPSSRVVLGPLGRKDTAELMRQALDTVLPESAEALHQATEGNPLFIRHVLQRLAARRKETADIARTSAAIIGRCVLDRLSQLSPTAARLAASAAVLGPDAVELTTAARLAQLELTEAAAAADSLVRMRILKNCERLEFRLPVSGPAILDHMSAVARDAARLEAAACLHDAGASAEPVARQLIGTNTAAPFPWAIDVLREAARAARRRDDHVSAVRYMRRAARDVTGSERDGVETELADLLLLVDLSQGIDHLASTSAEEADPNRSRDRLCRLGYALHLHDGHARGRQALTEWSKTSATSPPDHVLWAQLNLLYVDACSSTDRRICGRISDLLPLVPETSSTLRNAAAVLCGLIDYAAGRPAAAAVEAADRALGDPRLHELANPLPIVSALMVTAYQGNAERAYEVACDLALMARREGRPLQAAAFRLVCGLTMGLLGDYLTAERMLQETLCTLDGHRVWRGQPLRVVTVAGLLDVLVSKGDLPRARKLLNDNGLAGELPHRWDGLNLLLQRSRLKSASGDLRGTLADLRQCRKYATAFGGIRQEIVPWRSHMVMALHYLGHRSEARHLMEQDLAEARRDPSPRGLGTALHAAGVVTGGEAGIALLHESAAFLESCGADGQLAGVWCELGHLLSQQGRPEHAWELLERARHLARDRGAAPVVEAARRRLARGGAARGLSRSSTANGTGLFALTGQERRALSAALRGDPNSRIAEVMHITRRTVELHLSSSYRKLGIRGRREFAKLFAEQELWAILAEE